MRNAKHMTIRKARELRGERQLDRMGGDLREEAAGAQDESGDTAFQGVWRHSGLDTAPDALGPVSPVGRVEGEARGGATSEGRDPTSDLRAGARRGRAQRQPMWCRERRTLERESSRRKRRARKAASSATLQQACTWPEQRGDWLTCASTMGPASWSLGGRPLRGWSSKPATPCCAYRCSQVRTTSVPQAWIVAICGTE